MAQQYGYGYGYQPYNYAQPSPVPQAQSYGSYNAPAASGHTSYGQSPSSVPPQQQQQQQPNVGYSSYTHGSQTSVAPSPSNGGGYRQHQGSQPTTPSHGPPASQNRGSSSGGGGYATGTSPYNTGAGGSTYGASGSSYYGSGGQQQQQQQQQHNSSSSTATYKPLSSSYTPYHGQTKAHSSSTNQHTPAHPTTNQKHQATPTYSTNTTPYSSRSSTATSSSATPAVGYPSSASYQNNYYKPVKASPSIGPVGGAPVPAVLGTAVAYPTSYSSTATPTSSSDNSSLTPVQQHVVQQYINQKTYGTNSFSKPKKVYTPPADPQAFYCEVCKISAASALTYKTHLEGKNHKKKLAQQKVTTTPATSHLYCELCEVVCSSKDGLEAHLRGSKHGKVVNLYKKMGKPIPAANMTTSAEPSSSTTVTTAPRITFVGGKQLSSTGQTSSYPDGKPKLYPPTSTEITTEPLSSDDTATPPSATTVTDSKSATEPTTTTSTSTTTTATETAAAEPEPQPVGEHLVVPVSGDEKFPHATLKCELCDCYFNDDFAKKMHVKGRRHRLNYKKTYDSSLYVEPTKAMKKEFEKKKKQREIIQELRKTAAKANRRAMRGHGGRGGGWVGGGGITRGPAPGYSSGGGNFDDGGLMWAGQSMHPNEIRRQETLERARMEQMRQKSMGEGFFPPPLMGGGHPVTTPARNPHDDRIVLKKHSSIYPIDKEMKAVSTVVADVEKALKIISDDLLIELCNTSASGDQVVKKDESKRELKGVMRVGSFARGLLLKGECEVDLVLMTANKPDGALFIQLSNLLPAKFESMKKEGVVENVYNVNIDSNKAALIIISQVGDYRVQITVTLTSASMREEPDSDQAKADEERGVLDRQSCLAALAALRHTKWFQAMAHNLPSCVVIMRVLKDICQRIPAWGVLDDWIFQLLVQKCIVTANSDFTKPGDMFRRVMECVASGLFLPTGPGLSDPCEKGLVDAAAGLRAQDRVNITLSAQHALRLIAFGKLHLVLGVEPLDAGTERTSTEASGTKREAGDTGAMEDVKKRKVQT